MEDGFGVLPFQWESDGFISPFLATESTKDMEEMAEWIMEFLKTRSFISSSSKAHPEAIESSDSSCSYFRVIDLGCGDGTWVWGICKLLEEKWPTITDVSFHHNWIKEGLGLELDENLIAKCRSTANNLLNWEVTFRLSDLCTLTVNEICDLPLKIPPLLSKVITGTPAICHQVTICYLFLLPDALQVLQVLLTGLISHVDVVISRRWKIHYLEEYLIDKSAGCFWYSRHQLSFLHRKKLLNS